MTPGKISFQGELGAYSHQACRDVFPDAEAVPCRTFEAAIRALTDGETDLAMLPVENSTHGRVADIHHLLPESGLYIVGEHFLRVQIAFMGPRGSKLVDMRRGMSHAVLLGQVRNFLRSKQIDAVVGVDTAGSAREVAALNEPDTGAFASALAAEIYDLDILAPNIEDNDHNTTRFLICAREPAIPEGGDVITSFVFRVRNIPAALYKAMGGFATNGVNMVKLESYMLNGSFTATQFHADIEGHPDDPAVQRAMDELAYFTSHLKVLGSYPADPYRHAASQKSQREGERAAP